MLTHSHIHSANKKTADSISGFAPESAALHHFPDANKMVKKNNQIITKK